MSTARARANANYRRRHLDRIELSPQVETGTAIRSAAAAAGQSVQRYILDAVQARMAAEGAASPIEGPARDGKAPEGEDTTSTTETP